MPRSKPSKGHWGRAGSGRLAVSDAIDGMRTMYDGRRASPTGHGPERNRGLAANGIFEESEHRPRARKLCWYFDLYLFLTSGHNTASIELPRHHDRGTFQPMSAVGMQVTEDPLNR